MPARRTVTTQEEPKDEKPSKTVSASLAVVSIAIVMIRTFGWAGTTLVVGLLCVNWWATAEQKQRIVDMYILGSGISSRYPLIITCVIFALVILAQHRYYSYDKKKLKDEIERKEKVITKLEEQSIRKRGR